MDGLAQALGRRVQEAIGERAGKIFQHRDWLLATCETFLCLHERGATRLLAAFAQLLERSAMIAMAQPLGEARRFLLDDGFGQQGLFGADLAIVPALGGKVVEGIEKHVVQLFDGRVDVARHAQIDHEHGAMLAPSQRLTHRRQVDERIRTAGAGDQDIRLGQMGFQIGQADAESLDALGQRDGAADVAVGDDDASDALGVQMTGTQADHLAGAHHERGVFAKVAEDAPREVGRNGGDRYRLGADERVGSDPFGCGEAASEQPIQPMADMAVFEREAIGLLELTQDLGLADHHGVQSGCDTQEVAHHGIARQPIQAGVEFGARHVPIAAQPVDDRLVVLGAKIKFGAVAGGQEHHFLDRRLPAGVGQRPRHIACGIGDAFPHRYRGGGVIESDAEKGHCGARGERELRFCVKRSSQDKNGSVALLWGSTL